MEVLLRASGRHHMSILRALPVRRNVWVCQSCVTARQASKVRFVSNSGRGPVYGTPQNRDRQTQNAINASHRYQPEEEEDDNFDPTDRHSKRFDDDNQPLLNPNEPYVGKPYYVTTPIFYVNSTPHVGHLFSMVVADVFKRWHAFKGRKAYLSTGTDEHGMKVQRAAQAQGLTPKELCDTNAESFKDLARKANVSNDFFIRTTDPEHRAAVEAFWLRLRDSGYIYETKHEGWYCVSDEAFYPESALEKRRDRATGRTYLASKETGGEVEWTQERNYHFRLTAFRRQLLDFYRDNEKWLVPHTRFEEITKWVENHLEDLSISRPANRLSWGIPVPGDDTQTIYVWLDALVNYMTITGYPNWEKGGSWIDDSVNSAWPADLHVVGKDITRFHCVYWPAFLMALNIPLPKQVLSHGHWLMGKRKMSKSIGNVVNPFFALERWGVDTMRYFLILNAQNGEDSNYDNAFIVDTYKKGLQGGMGNLLNRVTRVKMWSLREVVKNSISDRDNLKLIVEVKDQKYRLWRDIQRVDGHMYYLNARGALQRIIALLAETQKFIHVMEPWAAIDKGEFNKAEQGIFWTAETLRICGILLQPFMPDKAAELLDRLGVAPERRGFEYTSIYADDSYGTPLIPLGEGAASSLFPPLPVED
ncbi:tRNA synthetases class I (M)-domain-containing protein [Xylariaceae sp. FL0255]|nr:tRNA synthetases class I (M)-domain-containing protein [Xylariaceae sp. FL0255]